MQGWPSSLNTSSCRKSDVKTTSVGSVSLLHPESTKHKATAAANALRRHLLNINSLLRFLGFLVEILEFKIACLLVVLYDTYSDSGILCLAHDILGS